MPAVLMNMMICESRHTPRENNAVAAEKRGCIDIPNVARFPMQMNIFI